MPPFFCSIFSVFFVLCFFTLSLSLVGVANKVTDIPSCSRLPRFPTPSSFDPLFLSPQRALIGFSALGLFTLLSVCACIRGTRLCRYQRLYVFFFVHQSLALFPFSRSCVHLQRAESKPFFFSSAAAVVKAVLLLLSPCFSVTVVSCSSMYSAFGVLVWLPVCPGFKTVATITTFLLFKLICSFFFLFAC